MTPMTPTKNDQQQLITWLLTGKTGLSSEYLASVAFGVEGVENNRPHDPADLNRCFELIYQVPFVAHALPKMAFKSKEWKILVENWDDLQRTFEAEVGRNWSKSHNAPKTYQAMKDLGL